MASYSSVMQTNQYVQGDALEFCRSLPDGSVDVYWASPPFNLADSFRGGKAPYKGGPSYQYGGENGRGDGSLMPEGDYQLEQIAVLTEWHRTLKSDGIAFYSHKNRHKDGALISPYAWIHQTPFVVLGEVVWDRRGTANVDTRRFLPTSERVYILGKKPGIRLNNKNRYGDVISVPPTHHKRAKSGHPAPSHPGIVRLCLQMVVWHKEWAKEPGGLEVPFAIPPLVVDCYAGIGTTGVVAAELGMDYLLCDSYEPYVQAGRERLATVLRLDRESWLPLRQLDLPEMPAPLPRTRKQRVHA